MYKILKRIVFTIISTMRSIRKERSACTVDIAACEQKQKVKPDTPNCEKLYLDYLMKRLLQKNILINSYYNVY